MTTNLPQVDIVVCHYNKSNLSHIRFMTLHTMSFLCKRGTQGFDITVVDGSSCIDEYLETELSKLGIRYVHIGKEMSLAETYNAGIRRGSSPLVVTLANDIFIESDQIRKMIPDIRGRIGCAIPYMTASDYGVQRERNIPVPTRCFPSGMTLNVNIFSRKALENIGLIPENMTGAFNDIVLFIKLLEAGYSVVLRNVGRIVHLSQQTIKSLDSSVSLQKDTLLFSMKYPDFWHKGFLLFHKLAQRSITRQIYRLMDLLPLKFRINSYLLNFLWTVEPYLCAERGAFKKGLKRVLGRRNFLENSVRN